MLIKKLALKLPFISARDAKLLELRDRNRKVHEQLARRDAKVVQLRAKVVQLRDDVAQLRDRNRKARAHIAQQDSETLELQDRNDELRNRITASQRPRVTPWSAPPEEEAQRLIGLSGLFDSAWYLEQVDRELVSSNPVLDYLRAGQADGLSPHPTFMPAVYVDHAKARKTRPLQPVTRTPLLHFLTVGAATGLSPHPAFDAEEYLTRHPDSRDTVGGPLTHFLDGSNGGLDSEGRDGIAFLSAVAAAGLMIRATRGYAHLERDAPHFDAVAETDVKSHLRRTALPEPLPLVSIIVPTKDRAGVLGAALDSALAQTYSAWELLVVDDGSTDSTSDLLDEYDDPRLRVVRHGTSRGVAAARNSGLSAATGQYIAYLDSDNTWFPDFLELMMRFIAREGHRVAYAMSALVEEGGEARSLYRGMSFDREALRERNYIDCIVLVHERSLMQEVGTFDESLRRNVDWDLFIRLADACDFGFLPVIATQYDVWETRNDRITTDEPMGYRFVVRQRALIDWTAQRIAVARRANELLSVVMVVAGDGPAAVESVQRVVATATTPVEVVVVDSRLAEAESVRLQCALHTMKSVRFHRLTTALPLEVARNVGASLSSGSTLLFLLEGSHCEARWDVPLKDALKDHSVVQPVTLTAGGAVWSAGVEFQEDGTSVMLYRGFAGDAPEVRRTREHKGVTAACMAVSAVDFMQAEGFDPLFSYHYSGSELSLRISARTGRPVASVGASRVCLSAQPAAKSPRRDQQNSARLRKVRGATPSRLASLLTADGYSMVGFVRLRNKQIEPTPLLIHQRPERPLRWALKVAAPHMAGRSNWGDWHFALALRDSLERCGHTVTIDCKNEWYRPSAYLDDVALHLRGLSAYEVNPAHTNVSWVISHPERVTVGELAEYDLAFGASARWSHRMQQKLDRPVETLLQCTDQRRFHPVEPDRHRAHRVLSVANARGIKPSNPDAPRVRSSVAAALDAGIVPSIYGLRWAEVVPEGSWQGSYLPNEELPAVYAAAGVVLNDHWDDMREEGLLSNRLFDLVASDARVISDDLPEIHELFDDVVLTYTSSADLPSLVDCHLRDSLERREARAAMGRWVREHHTFDARARTLSEKVLQRRAASSALAI